MGEEQEEVGQFGVGQRMSRGDERLAKLLSGGQGQAEAANVVVSIRKGPSFQPPWRRRPTGQEIMAVLAKLPLEVGQELFGQRQSTRDPAPQFSGVRKTAGQFRQRQSLVHEDLEHANDLTEVGRLVGQMGAGSDAGAASIRH